VDVIILKQGMPVGVGKIVNGNRWGVYVLSEFRHLETEQQISLEVIHMRAERFIQKSIKIEALVIHTNNQGFGLEIDIESTEQADLFLQMLSNSISNQEWSEPRIRKLANA